MYRLTGIVLFSILGIFACTKVTQQSSVLPQDEFIQVYFNHRESNSVYAEPYRDLKRHGDNLESIIIQEITAAQAKIDLAVQELNLPLVAHALVERHRSGVMVRVILDNQYSRSQSKLTHQEIKQLNQRDQQKYQNYLKLVDLNQDHQLSFQEIAQRDALVILEQAGIPIIDDTADGTKGSGLMHHKFMVVDDRTVVTGSTNFTLSGVHGDLDNLATRGNVNHLLRINNHQVADLFTEEFNYMWGDSPDGGINSRFGLDKPWRSPQTISWNNTEIILQFAPTSRKQDWYSSTNGLIASIIQNASKSIDLVLFVFSEQQIANVLQEKHQQGIRIQGVFDRGFAYRYYSEVLDMLGATSYLRCQAEAENNPWLNPLNTISTAQLAMGDKLHHKFTVIDHETVITGSQNWSKTANVNNDESLVILHNVQVSKHFLQEFKRLYRSASIGLSASIRNKLKQQHESCK